MSVEQQEQKIYALIESIAVSLGLELVELKIGRHQKDVFLQVLADTSQGNIGIEECTRLNRSIVEAIDKEGFFGEDGYSLEVSSPGLDRPLVLQKDFSRYIDAEVRVWLKEKVAGKVEHLGVIKQVTADGLVLLLIKEKQEITVPLNLVVKGLLEI